jgi:hypothetical protein
MAREKGWILAVVVVLGSAAVPREARAVDGGASPLADDPTLVALAVGLSCAPAPDGVEAAPAGPSGPAATGPEVELVATVRAKTLRFEVVPKVTVAFHGKSSRKTVWKTERVNLPMHPEPGVTYHDVQVRLTVSSGIDELGELLRTAKQASRGIRIENEAAAPVAKAAADAKPATAAAPAAKAAPDVKPASVAAPAAPAPGR